MPKTSPSKPVINGTAAAPDNCKGSGRPWESGGICPECRASADTMIAAGVVSRRADGGLSPRVPRHTQVLNPLPEPASPQPVARGRSAAPEPETSGKAPQTSVGARKPSGRTVTAAPELNGRKTAPSPAKSALARAEPAPAKALAKDRTKTAPTPKRKEAQDPLTKPFTSTIEDYLEWLPGKLGRTFTKAERELAGRAITLYSTFQVSPERRATRAAKR